jgi:MFS superfamily sulfate permease-like transporter
MQKENKKTGSLARYNKAWLPGDIVAGLSVWALMVPQCLGFAAVQWFSKKEKHISGNN